MFTTRKGFPRMTTFAVTGSAPELQVSWHTNPDPQVDITIIDARGTHTIELDLDDAVKVAREILRVAACAQREEAGDADHATGYVGNIEDMYQWLARYQGDDVKTKGAPTNPTWDGEKWVTK